MNTFGLHPIKGRYARRVVREKIAAEIEVLRQMPGNPFSGLPPCSPDDLPRDKNYKNGKLGEEVSEQTAPQLPPRKVCIVGAGVAGLYIAMILDDLNIPNLTYEILEANSRVGGRAYTHHFSDKSHDYYDIGAMRFPNTKTMKRTFKLIEDTKTPTLPYYLIGSNTPKLFNGRFFAPGPDPHHVGVGNGGEVADSVVDKVDDILEKAFGPYKEALTENFKKGFEKLKEVDHFSTREFLEKGGPKGDDKQKYDAPSIKWMETQTSSTGLFDQAFSESVIDSFDFDEKPLWFCIDGGTSVLTDAMRKGLSTEVQTNTKVEAISIDRNLKQDGNMSVKCAGESNWRTDYSTVFNTTTLGCLNRMDLSGLDLHPTQLKAIHTLHYDDSAKVALKFKYPWWVKDCGITKGGVAKTDLPLRTCVYPSYNIDTPLDEPAVLLASYTWAKDAEKMGEYIKPTSPKGEEELVKLILQDLAILHSEHITYERIEEALITHHAYAWSHDPFMTAAFALFGPGQFVELYPYLSEPAADSKFHIVGEASSVHHAWIVGALDSALAAVYLFLYRYGLWRYVAKLIANWGLVGDLELGEFGTAHLKVVLGRLSKEFHVKV
ncbi:hypothetical protein TWF569_010210 [Orbilia oligospora]|uniref:Amine oxidase domain-containing protein n=1 Tax=Orbilia oligospora TaxID=2813651 RepID=A0A7C8NKC7_ORBOL|nr:hypothetical protein TWF706_004281 [Orbilia oligospora]KAF3112808.1 hypothetical protein TWF102_004204 [Orbilia oligospora]KAF3117734.1 hypothetical protein TWF103_004414 [Orbilia oligospora]KAF3134331.1 hypothetical protein TWF569_010210 [Orbilia oligospora]KAF3151975.1 hypothetical protein TWF594_005731 [Orbilia oligospora]